MKPAFDEHKVDQSLAKISDVLHHPSGGHGAPSWAGANSHAVVKALEQLQERMRARHANLQQGAFPSAIYAARELDKYIAGMRCDIANRDAAEVYYRCLAGLISELRPLDQQLSKEAA